MTKAVSQEPRYVVIAMSGRYHVIDRVDGFKILPPNWKTRKAAERWVARQVRSAS